MLQQSDYEILVWLKLIGAFFEVMNEGSPMSAVFQLRAGAPQLERSESIVSQLEILRLKRIDLE